MGEGEFEGTGPEHFTIVVNVLLLLLLLLRLGHLSPLRQLLSGMSGSVSGIKP